MTASFFFKRLAVVTAGISAALLLLHFLAPPAQVHGWFGVLCVALFILICVGLFFAGVSTAQSKNKMAFSNLISVSVFGKMVAALAFLFVYQQVTHPSNQWFVGIFLLCYVVYTVFEVWFMMILAKRS